MFLFHQFVLLPRNDSYYFQKVKKMSNRETGEYVIRLFPQAGKKWSNPSKHSS